MLSWWKKKFSNGFGSPSPYERQSVGRVRHSASSSNSTTVSIAYTERDISSCELDTIERDRSGLQDKSVTQCCRAFANWYGSLDVSVEDVIPDKHP